jgi:fructan beta-fructosidase
MRLFQATPAWIAVAAWAAGCGSSQPADTTAPQEHAAATSVALYSEPLRPRIHFTPARNFMNDPNGLVHYDGEYHLFYQHNPFGTTWGHMSWGHAVSRDLLHWEHLPVALAEEDGVMIFSGSAVVDRHNTSGLCEPRGDDPSCLVAIYTGHGHGRQTQNLAVSQDRGRTWTKYAGNPVIDLGLRDFRDPKVFWHEPTQRWVMVTVLSDQHIVRLFGSRDLKTWEALSDFGPAGATGGVWECPDLMEVPIEGEPGATRWVLDVDINPGGVAGGSGDQYFVGTFDGTRFVNDAPADQTLWVDYGKDFYATISFSDLPDADRGPIWMAWISNWQYANEVPTGVWRGAQSLPQRLSLRRTPIGLRLVQRPAVDLAVLADPEGDADRSLTGPRSLPPTADISFVVSEADADGVGLRLFNDDGEEVTVVVAAGRGELAVDRRHSRQGEAPVGYAERHVAPLRPLVEVPVRVIFDRSVLVVYANDGETVMTERIFPTTPFTRVEWIAGRAPARGTPDLRALRSVWQ